MGIEKYIPELLKEGLIDNDQANNILKFYENKSNNSNNKIVLTFAIIGAILIGLGIVILIAYNWSSYSKITKVALAFSPLLITQIIGFYILLRKNESATIKESIAILIFFSLAACISMISNVYQIYGDYSDFLLTWMLLGLPLIFLFKSSVVAILFTAGITNYACDLGYFSYPNIEPFLYWAMLLIVVFYFILLYRKDNNHYLTVILSLAILISIIICFGTLGHNFSEFLTFDYFLLFSFILLFTKLFFTNSENIYNSWRAIAYLGLIIQLNILSYDSAWSIFDYQKYNNIAVYFNIEFILIYLLFIANLILSVILYSNKDRNFNYYEFLYVAAIILLIFGVYFDLGALVANLLLVALGVITILTGIKQDKLAIMNFGLVIICLLIIHRFFDNEFTFLFKGITFIIYGLLFFLSNYFIIRRRKLNAK